LSARVFQWAYGRKLVDTCLRRNDSNYIISMKKRVYLDHAAATPIDSRVKDAMEPFLTTEFGNAGGLYEEGRRAKEAITAARETIAKIIGARAEETIFTSGGTESDNLAISGITEASMMRNENSRRGRAVAEYNSDFVRDGVKEFSGRIIDARRLHIITTKFEHHAVLEPCQRLEKEGFDVTYLDVGGDGIVNPEDMQKALRPETILVSIMYANNEIGTIQPIAEIGKIIKEYREKKENADKHLGVGLPSRSTTPKWPFFHTDACQAAGYLDTNVNNLGVDLMTINAAKIYGPKGIGILYRRMGILLKSQIIGGGQEMRMRSGTENVAFIVGMAKALEIAQANKEKEMARLTPLRDYFISEIQKRVPKTVLNGHPTRRLPNNVNVSILDIEGEALVLYLDAKGIAFSTGSACTSESLDPSHVILALGKPYEFAHSSMRFTMGRSTTKKDIDYVLDVLPKIVEWFRKVSPVNVDINAKSISHPEVFAGKLKGKAKGKNYK